MKKWRCTVCKYVHEGDEPPDRCPICKVGKDKFVEIRDEAVVAEEEKREARIEARKNAILKHHIHPMSVHVPNGVVPVSFIFVVVATTLDFAGLSTAAFYNYLMVLTSMPIVLYSGWVEWRKSYEGVWSSRIVIKFVCAGVVTLGLAGLVFWHVYDPTVLKSGSTGRWFYVSLNVVVLLATSIAGFIGGKFVFKD